jgi:hypothetical protein
VGKPLVKEPPRFLDAKVRQLVRRSSADEAGKVPIDKEESESRTKQIFLAGKNLWTDEPVCLTFMKITETGGRIPCGRFAFRREIRYRMYLKRAP